MLRKLIKHEWLRLWKIPAFLLILLQVLAAVAGLTFLRPVFESEIGGLEVLRGLVLSSFIIAVIGVMLGIYIYLALQFYKSTYSDEGYLTHTLPVSAHQLLISKISVIAIWEMITIAGILLACSVFGAIGLACQGSSWSDVQMGIEILLESIQDTFYFGPAEWANAILATVVSTIVGIIYNGAWIVASVTIGQMAKKHRIAAAIGAACLISFLLSSVQNIIQNPFEMILTQDMGYFAQFVLKTVWIEVAVYGAAVLVLYFISEYLVRNRLNLE